jgi:hypothetical protein
LFLTLLHSDDLARLKLYVATAPSLAGVTGRYFKPVGVEVLPSALGRDAALARRLWEVSAQCTARFMASRGTEGAEQ